MLSSGAPDTIKCAVQQCVEPPPGKKAQKLAVPLLAEPLLSGLAPQIGKSFSPDALTQTERHVAFHQ